METNALDSLWGDIDTLPEIEPKKEPVEPTETEEPTEEEEEAEEQEEEEAPEVVDIDELEPSILNKLGLIDKIPENADPEDILELANQNLDEIIQNGVQETIKGWQETLPDEAISLIKYTFNGGKAEDFFKTYTDTPLELFDLESETGQENFVRFYLKKQGKSADEVDEELEFFIDRGNLETKAKSFFSKLKTTREKEIENKILEQTKLREEAEEKAKANAAAMREKLAKADKFQDYRFNDIEKKTLARYILEPTVVDGRQTTQIAQDLNKVYRESPEKLMLLAKLIKSDFDLSFLTKPMKKVAQKEVKEKLQKVTKSDNNETFWD